MNGFFLWVPFFLIRFALLSGLSADAVERAARFAPMRGGERWAYWVYQLTTAALIVCSPLTRVEVGEALFVPGLVCYLAGLALCAASMQSFASPSEDGLNTAGMYRFSRNPMYVAYFVCFLGMALLTQSWLLSGILVLFQVSCHWVILAEERWCTERFGEAYLSYQRRVRRYL